MLDFLRRSRPHRTHRSLRNCAAARRAGGNALVPDTREDGARNGVSAARLEKKLGLHGSPTCVMNFEDSEAIPIGCPGRGLPTLFAMIIAMRMSVAAQGAAVAQAASSIAKTYARERGQGGRPDAPPTPIETHAEVRRLLLQMRTRAEAARLIALQTAAWIDQGDAGEEAAAARAAMMLPMAKTICAEAATANADAAIQVLGGAGYVKEWPVERMLRDARVFSIYEGTTAIQGIDLLQRRVLGQHGDCVLADLLEHLAPQPALAEQIQSLVAWLSRASPRVVEAASVPFMRLLGLAAADGMLHRAAKCAGPLAPRYAALAQFHGAEARSRAAQLSERCRYDNLDSAFDVAFAA